MTGQERIGSAFAGLNALLIDLGPAVIAEFFGTHPDWLYAQDLFNEGYTREAHEA